jgi:hypothetical protein
MRLCLKNETIARRRRRRRRIYPGERFSRRRAGGNASCTQTLRGTTTTPSFCRLVEHEVSQNITTASPSGCFRRGGENPRMSRNPEGKSEFLQPRRPHAQLAGAPSLSARRPGWVTVDATELAAARLCVESPSWSSSSCRPDHRHCAMLGRGWPVPGGRSRSGGQKWVAPYSYQ